MATNTPDWQDLVAMCLADHTTCEPAQLFTTEGDYLGLAVNFFLPLARLGSCRVSVGNHANDRDDEPFDTDFFDFTARLQDVFENYIDKHEHDGHIYLQHDLCYDYHRQWAAWLHTYADRLERMCRDFAIQERGPNAEELRHGGSVADLAG